MLTIILFGLFGSILGDLISLRKMIKNSKKDNFNFRKIYFYIPILINMFIAFGFLMVYYYTDKNVTPILAVHIGASSPIMARVLIS